MKYSITLGLFVIFILPATAQVREADRLFSKQRYAAAFAVYKSAVAKAPKPVKANILFQLAECERHLSHFADAAKYYSRARSSGCSQGRILLLEADMLRTLGNYAQAGQLYKQYQQQEPSDPAGQKGILSCDLALRWLNENHDQWKIENEKLLNTAQDDFSPTWIDRRHTGLIFTSLRSAKSNDPVDPISGAAYSDMYESRSSRNGLWSAPAALDKVVNLPRSNEGSSCIVTRNNRIYFTRSERVRKQLTTCQIWYADKIGNSWGNPVHVNFQLPTTLLDSFNFRHPTISADGQLMVFSSDMTGSQGSDLWVSQWNARTRIWMKPSHLTGSFSTPGRECFPYLHDDGTLYFATDGLPGMGGLDLFRASKKAGNTWSWNEPENLRLPFNSPADDFGILFDGLQRRGYLSSNRDGGRGHDDIWYFEGCAKQIQGLVRDCETQLPISNAVVSVTPLSGATFQISTTADGEFSFTGRDQVRYTMQVDGTRATTTNTSKGYLSLKAEQKLEVYCAADSLCTISTACCLSPIKDQEISFPAVFYEVNSAELLPEARDSLDYLYRLPSENPHIVIELAAHTDCRGSMEDNLLLSQRRAQACVDYLVKEKGIDPKRLVAKGYGEGNPLRLEHKTVLSEVYITAQPENQREALHQLNRRTVFRIIAIDFDLNADPAQEIKVKKGFFDDSAPVEQEGEED